MRRALTAALAVALGLGCASPRPKFYPNAYYKAVGDPAAQKDADECLAKAKEYLKENPLKPVAQKTAWGAFTGALMGGVIGAITGNFGSAVAAGAAAGGVGGAASGTYDANTPDGVVRGYTDRCLAERGYEVIGWR
jgi:outer membrane lipoprotein SlyB